MHLSKLALITLILATSLSKVIFSPQAVSAGSLTTVSDNLSRLKTGVSATHTWTFTLATALGASSKLRFTQANFTYTGSPSFSGTGSCAATAGAFSANVTNLTSVSSCDAGDVVTLTTAAITNPAAATYVFVVETDPNNDGTYTDGDSSNVAVDILSEDQVTVSATINATYDFTIAAKTSGTIGSGGDTCETTGTTASSINFNNGVALSTGVQYTHCQTLTVSTNATSGHNTYVKQSANLTNGTADTINSFDDGTPPTLNSEAVWSTPTSGGHIGFTSTDTVSGSAFDATGTKFGGFTGTTTYKIFDAAVPVNGTGAGGTADIGYSLQITGTQQAGTYTNTLTYTSYGVF